MKNTLSPYGDGFSVEKFIVPPAMFGILAAICAQADAGVPITVRGLMRMLGKKSTNSLIEPLNRLQNMGLISRDYGKSATIRPLCRISLFAEDKPAARGDKGQREDRPLSRRSRQARIKKKNVRTES